MKQSKMLKNNKMIDIFLIESKIDNKLNQNKAIRRRQKSNKSSNRKKRERQKSKNNKKNNSNLIIF